MKRVIAIIALSVAFAAGLSAQNARAIYNKYSDTKGVSAVYISPAMFSLMGRLPQLDLDSESGIDISGIVKSMSGFYLISAETGSELSERLSKDVKSLIGRGSYELMLEAKEDGEAVRIFSSSNRDGDITELLFTTKDEDEATFICVTGLMSRADLEKLLADADKGR